MARLLADDNPHFRFVDDAHADSRIDDGVVRSYDSAGLLHKDARTIASRLIAVVRCDGDDLVRVRVNRREQLRIRQSADPLAGGRGVVQTAIQGIHIIALNDAPLYPVVPRKSRDVHWVASCVLVLSTRALYTTE